MICGFGPTSCFLPQSLAFPLPTAPSTLILACCQSTGSRCGFQVEALRDLTGKWLRHFRAQTLARVSLPIVGRLKFSTESRPKGTIDCCDNHRESLCIAQVTRDRHLYHPSLGSPSKTLILACCKLSHVPSAGGAPCNRTDVFRFQENLRPTAVMTAT